MARQLKVISPTQATVIALATTFVLSLPISAQECRGDLNGDGVVTVDEILTAVNSALNGCPTPPSARFVDNADGTITDHQTKLMWEKKAASDSSQDWNDPHDTDNLYRWAGKCRSSGALCQPTDAAAQACPAGSVGCALCGADNGDCQVEQPAATTIFDWLAQLNAGHFAGYADWRIPTREELESIVDLTRTRSPVVGGAFFTLTCYEGCASISDPECSCTVSSNYWTVTTFAVSNPANAWIVEFDIGYVVANDKSNPDYVRAVRSVP